MKEEFIYERKSIIDRSNHCKVMITIDELGDEDAAYQVSYVMNSRAPLTLRVNPLKTTKHEVAVL